MVYRPKFVSAGRMVGPKVLLCWQSEALGAVFPGAFIPLVEACGLVLDLTRVVLENTRAFIRQQRDRGVFCPLVAIDDFGMGCASLSKNCAVFR